MLQQTRSIASDAGGGAGLWEERAQIAMAVVLAATVLFNPVLAIINGHVVSLGGSLVAATQAGLVGAALLLGSLTRRPPVAWLVFAWCVSLAFLVLTLFREYLDVKSLGDMLMIPAFICLGSRLRGPLLLRVFLILQFLNVVVGVWELLSPTSYAAVFQVQKYYVGTRGFDENSFWAGGDLFVSSQRPGGRLLLAGTNFHRGSSLFLEPVSLGNWTVVAALMTAAFWHKIGWKMRIWLLFSTLVLETVCDGRLSLGVCLLLAGALPLLRFVPSRVSLAYVPLLSLALVAARAVGKLPSGGDTLTGRLRGGLDTLSSEDLPHLMGISGISGGAADAGWVYLIETQSIFVALALLITLVLMDTGEEQDARMFKHGLVIFIALCLPISYSMLSIKTMAMAWACYGFFWGRAARARAAAMPVRDRSGRRAFGRGAAFGGPRTGAA